MLGLLRVYTPGGTDVDELEKTISRCRAAEKRLSDLEAGAHKTRKRRLVTDNCKWGSRHPHAKTTRLPDVGFWVRMPTLRSSSKTMLFSHRDVQHSRQFGQVIAMDERRCVVRFRSVDKNALVSQGVRQPSTEYNDVEIPSTFVFDAVFSPEEAEWSIPKKSLYCILAKEKAARKRRQRADLQKELKKG